MKSYMLNLYVQMEGDLRGMWCTFVAEILRWVIGYNAGYYGRSMIRALQRFMQQKKSNGASGGPANRYILVNSKQTSEWSGSEDVDG